MKPKLRLVKNAKRVKPSHTLKPVRPRVMKAFNRAIKEAQRHGWTSVIIIGSDNNIFHTPMRYKDLIGLLEMNKHATIQEWLKD